MVLLGLLLLLVGAGAIAACVATAVVVGTQVEVLGLALSPVTFLLVAVGATLAVVWGLGLIRFSIRRGLQRRRTGQDVDRPVATG